MKRALICGISGQDGGYLAEFLIGKGYEVWGTSRDAQISSFSNLSMLGVRSQVNLISMAPNDFRSVLQVLSLSQPDEIYNLAGQSSVGLSFEQPAETLESIAISVLNLLEAIRFLGAKSRFYNAGSSECFGDVGGNPADENTIFQPRSPYATAKATAHWLVANYREAYGINACSGILFNHESPLRPARFVTQKIVKSAVSIAQGKADKLVLGNLNIARDWGWAPEYVKAMWGMLQLDRPEDFVIATGKSHTLLNFIEYVFLELNLDWRRYVVSDPALFRANEIERSCGNPIKAKKILNWEAKVNLQDIARKMVKFESERVE